MKSISRTRSIGGSLIVTIPREVVKKESLQEGEIVRIEIKKIKNDFFGELKGIGSFEKEDRLMGQIE
jgi:hypothetical protein